MAFGLAYHFQSDIMLWRRVSPFVAFLRNCLAFDDAAERHRKSIENHLIEWKDGSTGSEIDTFNSIIEEDEETDGRRRETMRVES